MAMARCFVEAIFISNHFFFISVTLRTAGDTELTATRNFFPFLRFSRSRKSTADTAKDGRFSSLDLWKQNFSLRAVKLFFLRLDAVLMTQHESVALYGIILGVEYANLTTYFNNVLKYARVAFIIYAGRSHTFLKLRAFVESDVTCSYETVIQKSERHLE